MDCVSRKNTEMDLLYVTHTPLYNIQGGYLVKVCMFLISDHGLSHPQLIYYFH